MGTSEGIGGGLQEFTVDQPAPVDDGRRRSGLKVWPVLGIAILQAFLLLAHWFLFLTVVHFFPIGGPVQEALGAVLLVLAISFVAASVWSFRQTNVLARAAYKVAAVWLGFLNFFFWAACLCRLAELGIWLAGMDTSQARLAVAGLLFGLAALAGLYGLLNAKHIRERRVTVTLPAFPSVG